jgi:hypothetical protein
MRSKMRGFLVPGIMAILLVYGFIEANAVYSGADAALVKVQK